MQHGNRSYGLMAGIAVGFAVWGSAGNAGAAGDFLPPVLSEKVTQRYAMREEAGIAPAPVLQSVSVIMQKSVPQPESEALSESVPRLVSDAASQPAPQSASQSASQPAPQSASQSASQSEPQSVPQPAPAPSLHSLSAVLMDGDSGRILYEKDGDSFRPMASTTKIMTCILALENGSLTDICTASKTAAAQPKVHLGVREGQQFYLKDLLYSLMLESHNDAAVMIAEHLGGSVEGFAKLMNQKARDLGCKDTYFVTPNGLDAAVTETDGTERTHGTTAADLARIMRYCILESPKREDFLAVTQTGNYSFNDLEGKNSYSCLNHNALLTMMEGAVSGKTGFTGGAGYSYVGAVEDGGRTFTFALLGCGWPPHKNWKWTDARALIAYGKENFHLRELPPRPELPCLLVENGIPEAGEKTADLKLTYEEVEGDRENGGNAAVRSENGNTRFLLAEWERVEQSLKLPRALHAPVQAGCLVGTLEYRLNGSPLRMEPVFSANDIKEKNFFYYNGVVRNYFLIGKNR